MVAPVIFGNEYALIARFKLAVHWRVDVDIAGAVANADQRTGLKSHDGMAEKSSCQGRHFGGVDF